MAVMASWNGKTWGVSSQRIAALNGISHSVELDTENSDDKAGSPATKTKALKLQSMSFDFDLAAAVGCDVRSEYESWTALVGQYAPFYLAGRRFGPANLQLTGVSLSDTKLDNLGRILTGKITIKLTEYAEEASSKKASSGKSGKELTAWVKIGVAAAEQLYKGAGRGEEKKQYVIDFLKQKGFKVDEESVINAIEAAVKQLNTEGLTIE